MCPTPADTIPIVGQETEFQVGYFRLDDCDWSNICDTRPKAFFVSSATARMTLFSSGTLKAARVLFASSKMTS